MVTFDWEILKSINVVFRIFAIDLTISTILMFQVAYLKKIGQEHRLKLSYWCYSMANIKIHQSSYAFFG